MTMVTFDVGGDGSKPWIALVASYTSHWCQITVKKRKKNQIFNKRILPSPFYSHFDNFFSIIQNTDLDD
jgi:hypothetical protein